MVAAPVRYRARQMTENKLTVEQLRMLEVDLLRPGIRRRT
jgi:hypothetical protein